MSPLSLTWRTQTSTRGSEAAVHASNCHSLSWDAGEQRRPGWGPWSVQKGRGGRTRGTHNRSHWGVGTARSPSSIAQAGFAAAK